MKWDLAVMICISIFITILVYLSSTAYYCRELISWHFYCAPLSEFGSFYGNNIRGSLFTGFLTLGGFLLSLKTFIVVNMKKEVFDTNEYKQEWDEQKKLDADNKMGLRFEPLRYLSTTLFLAIFSCVTTAVLQLTLGLAGTLWAAIICLWTALFSIILLLRSLWLIRINLTRMFDFLDSKN